MMMYFHKLSRRPARPDGVGPADAVSLGDKVDDGDIPAIAGGVVPPGDGEEAVAVGEGELVAPGEGVVIPPGDGPCVTPEEGVCVGRGIGEVVG